MEQDFFLTEPEAPARIKLTFPIEVKAVQSVRHRIVMPKDPGKKPFVMTYQPKEVEQFKADIRRFTFDQIAEISHFKQLEGPIGLNIVYTYGFLKKHTQGQINKVYNGGVLWKTTAPDIDSNTNKGLVDAISGILWKNDAQICHITGIKKVYGPEASINIEAWEIKE